jgi:hypothetical protein
MTTKRPIDVGLNPKYTSIINVLNRTTKRPIDVRLNPIYTSIISVLNMTTKRPILMYILGSA